MVGVEVETSMVVEDWESSFELDSSSDVTIIGGSLMVSLVSVVVD